MIDINKQYRTRDGREVRLLMTVAGGPYPVIGAIKSGGTWAPVNWTVGGATYEGRVEPADLIEVKPKHVRWVNFYGNTFVIGGYTTREKADQEALPPRIACIRVEFEEGEGLT